MRISCHIGLSRLIERLVSYKNMLGKNQYALGFVICTALATIMMLYALVMYTPINCYGNDTHSHALT